MNWEINVITRKIKIVEIIELFGGARPKGGNKVLSEPRKANHNPWVWMHRDKVLRVIRENTGYVAVDNENWKGTKGWCCMRKRNKFGGYYFVVWKKIICLLPFVRPNLYFPNRHTTSMNLPRVGLSNAAIYLFLLIIRLSTLISFRLKQYPEHLPAFP